jgi:hypothetical protein
MSQSRFPQHARLDRHAVLNRYDPAIAISRRIRMTNHEQMASVVRPCRKRNVNEASREDAFFAVW